MKLRAGVRLIFGGDIFDTVLVKKGTPINGYAYGRIVMHCYTPLNVESYMNFLVNPE